MEHTPLAFPKRRCPPDWTGAGVCWRRKSWASIGIDESEERLGRLYDPAAGTALQEAVRDTGVSIPSMGLSATGGSPSEARTRLSGNGLGTS